MNNEKPIIKCKDCKYYHNLKIGVIYADNDFIQHYTQCEYFKEDDYCSKAVLYERLEKKENE